MSFGGEGILTDLSRDGPTQPHLYIPQALAFLNGFIFLVYYHHMEYWNRPHLVWLLLLYWILLIGGQVITLINLDYQGATGLEVLRFDISVLLLVIYLFYIILEIYIIKIKILGCGHVKDEIPRNLRKKNFLYLHKYTSLISRVTFQWLHWLLALGYKRPIEMDDLGALPEEDGDKHQYRLFLRAYENEKIRAAKKNVTPSLWRTQWHAYGTPIMLGGVLEFLSSVFTFIGPVAVGGVVAYATRVYYSTDEDEQSVDDGKRYVTVNEFISNGFVLVVIMFVSLILKSITLQYSMFIMTLEGMHVRTSLQNHVYEKSMRLSSWTMTGGDMTMGLITNHMSVDAVSVYWFYMLSHLLWGIPFQVLSDDRLKKSNELLQGMKLLKLYGWEKMFCVAIESVRKREVRKMMKFAVFQVATNFMTQATPMIVTLVSFAVYSLVSPVPLTPELAFSSLALFQQLIIPLFLLPLTINFTVNALVSVGRLQKFFVATEIEENDDGRPVLCSAEQQFLEEGSDDDDLLDIAQIKNIRGYKNASAYERVSLISPDDSDDDEKPGNSISNGGGYGAIGQTKLSWERKPHNVLPDNVAVMMKDGSYSWDVDHPICAINDVNLAIPAGKLTMIVGSVGSGKSSLLSAMLGEMTTVSGTVQFQKNIRVSYAAQKAWLQNATLKDNILFGAPFDVTRYNSVLDACALRPDIDILPGGDQTEIGEKGINLSGGQKQRISVARCIYSNTDLIILDDPLAALDVHVGRQLMLEGILGIVTKEKRTVILVSHQLQYLQYANKIVVMDGGKLYRQGNLDEIATEDPELYGHWKETIVLQTESEQESEAEEEITELERKQLMKQVSMISDDGTKLEKAGTTLIEEEERERGSVSWRVYLAYSKAITLPVEDFADDLDYWIGGYGGLAFVYILLTVAANSTHILSSVIAAKRIHISLLNNIVFAPMRFFDITPVGRILNRFSNDTQIIDQKIWQNINGVITTVFQVFAALIVNALVTPIFLAFVVPMLVVYYFIQSYFISTSRELQRLDSITKSPVFAHFSETLGGLSTVRGYRDERRFRRRLVDRIDRNNIAFLFLVTVNRWLAIRLDLVGGLIVVVSGIGTLIATSLGSISPSLVGLALSYALQTSGYLNWLIRQVADCEMQMNAVERVEHYTHISNETYKGTLEPPLEWPDNGDVKLHNVSARYAVDLEPVLHDITVHFKSGEKIGVCGRTGSGKSSLTLALFRVIDTFKGTITIDGIDISQVPLLTLRNRIAIIPQDPVLFSGTIRFNLDPLEQIADEKLWEALEIAQLKLIVLDLDDQLDAEVSEGGENFSVGQRQLFCLARAFLRNARILIMDEATASIDMKTDSILQNVVATSFTNITVITIAHRVATIMDSDTILVLSDGKIVEYDTPANLMKIEGSLFASLVKGKK
uniref:ATP-binding cassette sub-family C member 9-like n=1 Tax=Saccoglossus kowalevskii TaxID=10224 RepID=A0ABM0MLS5_SACKO|nr:PREDICTED: ATP-binding cassette sub-family C member 9-like [Saccoglossus kowalevskii]